jgi:hypothetical protein
MNDHVMTFTPNWKVGDMPMWVWKLKVKNEIKNYRAQDNSDLQLGTDKNLISRGLLGFNTRDNWV